MGDIELEMRKSVNGGKLILYDAWNMMGPTEFKSQQIGNCVLREHYVPRIEAESPTIEVEADEEDTREDTVASDEAECEAYDNGLDPELDYPGIESECFSTEEEEDDGVLDVPEDVLPSEEPTPQSYQEIEFLKVETT